MLLNDQEGIQPDWSPNGCQIVFAGPGNRGRRVIFSMDYDGNNLQTLTSGVGQQYHNSHPTWSPGGDRIAFIRSISGSQLLYTMNRNGSDLRVVPLGASVSEPDWGINGAIAFRRNSNGEIYRVFPDASGWRRLTTNPAFDGWPNW
jgi:TolB protein